MGRMRSRVSYRTRQTLTFRHFVATASIIVVVAGTMVFLSEFSRPEKAMAATCSSTYTVDWTNSATYTVNCGSVNASSWTVTAESCWYTCPTLYVGGVAGDPNKSVDLSVRINQSGNLTNNDYCWIYFYVNGVVQSSWIGRGDTVTSGVFYVPVVLTVPAGGNYRVAVHLNTDKNNEFWEVKKGDVISCVVATASSLPVALTSFSAAMTETGAKLNWTTESEIDNDHFTILRSDDGIEYTELGRIQGHGTTSIRSDYSFMDTEVPSGLNYYKLAQSDYDGTTKLYGPITLRNKNYRDIEASAFPNPFTERFNYSFGAAQAGTGELVICDLNGALLERIPVEYNKGVNTVEVTPTRLKTGLFVIGLRTGEQLEGVVKICRK